MVVAIFVNNGLDLSPLSIDVAQANGFVLDNQLTNLVLLQVKLRVLTTINNTGISLVTGEAQHRVNPELLPTIAVCA